VLLFFTTASKSENLLRVTEQFQPDILFTHFLYPLLRYPNIYMTNTTYFLAGRHLKNIGRL